MKILIEKEDILLLDDILYDVLLIATTGIRNLSLFFKVDKEKSYLFNAYSLWLNKYITGYYNLSFAAPNLYNQEVYNNIYILRIILIYYENNYHELETRYRYKKYKKYLSKGKIKEENDKYCLDVDNILYNTLILSFDYILGLYEVNKEVIISMLNCFYNFNNKDKTFNKYLNIYFNLINKTIKNKKINKIKELLMKFKEVGTLWFI